MPIKAKKKFHQSILFRISLVLLVMFIQLIWWVIFTLRDTQYRIDQVNTQIETELKFAEKLLANSA
ncbi:MAG: hypothetical protein KDD94_11105, partial [Calditrichaeota bacterium]|nr:hypothetical protein [Calditrichota bacterium]